MKMGVSALRPIRLPETAGQAADTAQRRQEALRPCELERGCHERSQHPSDLCPNRVRDIFGGGIMLPRKWRVNVGVDEIPANRDETHGRQDG